MICRSKSEREKYPKHSQPSISQRALSNFLSIGHTELEVMIPISLKIRVYYTCTVLMHQMGMMRAARSVQVAYRK